MKKCSRLQTCILIFHQKIMVAIYVAYNITDNIAICLFFLNTFNGHIFGVFFQYHHPGHFQFWKSICMMTPSNGNIICATGHLCGEFTGHRWIPRTVTQSFDVIFDLCLNKPLSKQLWGWWFETPLCPLWHHCNGLIFRITLKFDRCHCSLAAWTCQIRMWQ